MKKSFKLVFFFLALYSFRAAAAPYAPPPPLNPDVTPLRGEKNDLADVLGVLMWKFRVTTKQPNTKLVYKLSYDPLHTTFKPPAIPEFLYTQQATTEDVLIAFYPQSDGLHYFIRAGSASRPYVQEDKFAGWSIFYGGNEDGIVSSSRTGDGFYLFGFLRKAAGQKEYETLRVLLTVKPVPE